MNHPELISTPVLIIGAGAAGLRTALELVANGQDCLVVGKRRHGDAHTVWAAGGINASLGNRDPEDRWAIHAADTIKEGHYVCDPGAVELLARHAAERVLELQGWGCPFNLTEEGEIDQRYFGAQSYRRTCFVGDTTGRAILDTLVARAKALEVPYRQNLFVTRLLAWEGRVVGAFGIDLDGGRPVAIEAGAVVLAAGGHTSLYLRGSSRPDENTGDAVALAYAAGAELRDMEFVQFHPTGMVKPEERAGKLVTEAVRGEGGHLLNRDGERFMARYSPKGMELDARDVVARAIYSEIRNGRGTESGAVLLDISHRGRAFLEERLPEMLRQFAELGVDISREPVEVAPTAHYAMGGVRVDFRTGASTVPGLFAVGEATAGVHGANRLGGNSLVETLVFGQLTGRHLLGALEEAPAPGVGAALVEEETSTLEALLRGGGEHRPNELIAELRELLWDHAGIVRDEHDLKRGLARLEALSERARSLALAGGSRSPDLVAALNLRFMLPAAEAILRGALMRAESRGAHYRSDATGTLEEWTKSIVYAEQDGRMSLRTEALGEVSPDIQRALDEHHSLDYHHLE
ncbi:MAG: FAD-dependent oxidoreductase [Deinococcota bacterium]|nr:FAD-dependent oxidoreductase [Deinococcota bacterium]